MYDIFRDTIRQEITRQKNLMKEHVAFLDAAPEGWLTVRHRQSGIKYYRRQTIIEHGIGKDIEINISHDPIMISQLVQKEISSAIVKRCTANIKRLKKAEVKYQSIDMRDIASDISEKFLPLIDEQNYQMMQAWKNEGYHKNLDTYGNNTNTILNGEKVASKGEVIIADKLHMYGIPFHYDEAFSVPYAVGKYYYPDFTILLPDGRKIWWENLGMLDREDYAIHTGEKLYHYHRNGAVIGRNLILTSDDRDHSCDSAAIDRIIRDYILPHFQLSEINRRRKD